ncbi:MAG TPA: hypothetical protein VGE69_07330 [Pseudomonadales bacterium]
MDSYDDVEKYYRVLKDAILRSATQGAMAMEDIDLLQFINRPNPDAASLRRPRSESSRFGTGCG